MCGIAGILLISDCESSIEHQLDRCAKSLIHRGYDGCGIATDLTWSGSGLCRRRLLTLDTLNSSSGGVGVGDDDRRECEHDCQLRVPISGIAHTRYRTAGDCILRNTQPVMNKDKTLSLVHNGQVEVYKQVVFGGGGGSGGSGSESGSLEQIFDSKYILEVFERSYKQSGSIFRSIKSVHETVKGSYACLLLIKGIGIVAFRDLRGIRPLVFGCEYDIAYIQNDNPQRVARAIFASESVVLSNLKYRLVRDVRPGESIFVDFKGNVRYANYSHDVEKPMAITPTMEFVSMGCTTSYTPCLFEYIYLADQNSVIDGVKVGRAREIMGELLSEKLKRYYRPIDVVAPVPNTPVSATIALAQKTGIKYVNLLYLPKENSKTSRTFILPTQNKRELAVKDKFRINVDAISACQGKTLALVDDSIVRGTTMKIMVKMIRELVQPKKIILISLAPIIRYENIYGIDIPNRSALVAHDRTLREIAMQLDADEVIYGDLDNIVTAMRAEALKNGVYVDGYESSVFKK